MYPLNPLNAGVYETPDFYSQTIEEQQKEMIDIDMSKMPKVIDQQNEVEINVFSDYQNKLNSIPEQPVQYVNNNMANNYNISDDAMIQALQNHQNLSDTQLRELMYNNFKYILQNIFDNGNENNEFKSLVHVFTDTRVLQILGEIVYRVQLTDMEKTYCNKLVYDYVKCGINVKNTANESTAIAMKTFSNIVNRDKIPLIMELSYSEDIASNLAMVSRSSLDKSRCVRRLNNILIKLPTNFLTEELITATWYTVFNDVGATAITEGVMLDVHDTASMNQGTLENYTLINLALLSVLNNLSDNVLLKVLSSYSQDRVMYYSDKPVRFNLRSFAAQDFPRLDGAMKHLDNINKSPLIY